MRALTLIFLSIFSSQIHAEIQNTSKPFSWTGFYAGVSLGAIINESRLNANHSQFLSSGDIPNTVPYNEHLNTTDVLPGLQVGYHYQLPTNLVVGGELEFTYPDSSAEFIRSNTNEDGELEFDKFIFRNRLQGAIKGRLGFALNNFLPYVTAGVSFADTGMRYDNELNDKYQKDTVQTGWILGAGLEYALCGSLSIRTEYLYTDYGDPISMPMSVISNQFDPAGFAQMNLISHSVRAALNIRF